MAGVEPELLLQEMNSYRRLLAFQELEKPQFGPRDYPGFFVNKARGFLRFLTRHTSMPRSVPSSQVDTSNGYAHLQLTRGSQAEVKALQEEDVRRRVEVR